MIIIATLAIGADFRKRLAPALASKRAYAAKHGYVYLEAGDEVWDRTRPIAWSKVGFVLSILERVPDGTLLWLSDADVLITNPALRVEDHVLSLLPAGKDILMSMDACGHVNSGNMFMRAGPWLREFWRRIDAQTDLTYHIWWENAAIIRLLEEAAVAARVEVSDQHWRFNAYLQGLPGARLWLPGDLLVHFAGVYDLERMENLIDAIKSGKIPRLDMWDPKKIEFISI
jgi:hypothetical protein